MVDARCHGAGLTSWNSIRVVVCLCSVYWQHRQRCGGASLLMLAAAAARLPRVDVFVTVALHACICWLQLLQLAYSSQVDCTVPMTAVWGSCLACQMYMPHHIVRFVWRGPARLVVRCKCMDCDLRQFSARRLYSYSTCMITPFLYPSKRSGSAAAAAAANVAHIARCITTAYFPYFGWRPGPLDIASCAAARACISTMHCFKHEICEMTSLHMRLPNLQLFGTCCRSHRRRG